MEKYTCQPSPGSRARLWLRVGDKTPTDGEGLDGFGGCEQKEMEDTHRWNEVGLHSVRMQHGEPLLQRTDAHALSWQKKKKNCSHQPFKTLEATLHSVSKFPFRSTKAPPPQKKKKPERGLFFLSLFGRVLDVSGSLGPPAVPSSAKTNKPRSSTVT